MRAAEDMKGKGARVSVGNVFDLEEGEIDRVNGAAYKELLA